MTKSKTTSSFRFDIDFIDLLNTWSFVSKREKGALLQEAFREYTKMKQNSDIAEKVNMILESLKED
ncbi:hypothetical protein BBD42_21025 [Paenibacillus sp. BIHB 4019]|uniref:CopG family transcriptional regulator n=1 Tax=Paenibacillus sp. BIHB 4019 TaxID=1870819 RepID=A0A1B2DLU4_9BACL|nr:hypothetical protein BBD42_21025 [Paenibacillus sp. BIHB 4019]